MGFKKGDRVSFMKAGRFPSQVSGTVEWAGDTSDPNTWLDIECDDGTVRKARPKSLTLICNKD
jgi:hypothetical protein